MRAFADGIAGHPGRYQLGDAEAAGISQAVERFETALAVALDESTRTKVSVSAKDEARNAAKQLCRQYARLIKFNAGIDDAAKIAIGVPPVNPERRRRNAPMTSPAVFIVGATFGAHTLRYHDSFTPEKRAMPFGATCIQLFVAIGEEIAHDPDQAKFIGSYTKTPTTVEFTAADSGKYATYFARWASQRGETGPWSIPASLRIAA